MPCQGDVAELMKRYDLMQFCINNMLEAFGNATTLIVSLAYPTSALLACSLARLSDGCSSRTATAAGLASTWSWALPATTMPWAWPCPSTFWRRAGWCTRSVTAGLVFVVTCCHGLSLSGQRGAQLPHLLLPAGRPVSARAGQVPFGRRRGGLCLRQRRGHPLSQVSHLVAAHA